MLKIDSNTYGIKEYNHYKTQIAKTQIILATSLRKGNNHIIRLQNKDYHKTKKWNTYTVSRTGDIYQHFDPIFYSDFLGVKEVDKKSISIVLENMGCLFVTPNDKYINWINEVCETQNVEEKEWSGYKYWEKIPEDQIEFHHYNKEIHKFKGIAFRSNYIVDSSDINPLFDIQKFNEMLQNENI